MPTADEIKQIIELYDNGNGLSQGQIAKRLGKGKTTIHRWLEDLGILTGTDAERSGTKKALTWTRERRLQLNDKFIDIVCERIKKPDISTSDLKSLATTYAIMIDKREILEPPAPLKAEDDGFFSELECKAEEVWQDVDAQDFPVQVDPTKPQAMANPNLVDKSITDTEP